MTDKILALIYMTSGCSFDDNMPPYYQMLLHFQTKIAGASKACRLKSIGSFLTNSFQPKVDETKALPIRKFIYHSLEPSSGSRGFVTCDVSLFSAITIIKEIDRLYQYLTAINI